MSAPDAVSRFTGFAADYDAARPRPPAAVIEVIKQWSGAAVPDVVDLGAGTGLSAVIWAGHARTVTAIEPSADMRAVAGQRMAAGWYTVADGTAERTGLPAACADIVTVSQAMHWFDADRALPEIARILRPGGVLAAYDCDWPPCIDWETDAAYLATDTRVRELKAARGLEPPRAGELGLTALREVAQRRLPRPRTWWWTYRIRLAVR